MSEKKYETEEERLAARRAYMKEYMKEYRERRKKEGRAYKPNAPENGKPGRPAQMTPEERKAHKCYLARKRYFKIYYGMDEPPPVGTRMAKSKVPTEEQARLEHKRKKAREYYWKNRDHLLKWYRTAYQNNKEHVKERMRKWKERKRKEVSEQ